MKEKFSCTVVSNAFCSKQIPGTVQGTVLTKISCLPPRLYLKVPSHQIRLCLKWYGWIGLDKYKDRGW